jgi:hypothetical protein
MAKSHDYNITSDADYAAAQAKEFEIQQQYNAAIADAESLNATDKDAPRQVDIDADAVLGIATATKAAPKLSQTDALHRVRVLATALEKQRRIRQEAEHRASLRIAEKAKPEYATRLKSVKDAALPLRDALAAELAFRQKLNDGGVSASAMNYCPLRISAEGIDAWLAELASKHGI